MIDETGDLKKGTATLGRAAPVHRDCGKIDNGQVAVYLVYAAAAGVYAAPAGHAVIDRELYLPKGWDRRR